MLAAALHRSLVAGGRGRTRLPAPARPAIYFTTSWLELIYVYTRRWSCSPERYVLYQVPISLAPMVIPVAEMYAGGVLL